MTVRKRILVILGILLLLIGIGAGIAAASIRSVNR